MSDPSIPPTPRWIVNWLVAVAFIGSLFTAATMALAIHGDRVLPAPTSAIIEISLSTTFLTLLALGLFYRTVGYIHASVQGAAYRMDRRMQSIGNAMVEHGIQLDNITGEIPRVRPLIVACNHGTNPVGRASVNGGLDPTVLEMGDRIARRLQGD